MPLPAIILVHGAWHTPANYSSFISALKSQGFTVHCPLLPSCNKALQPTTSLADDTACIRELISRLTLAGEKILLIMHSYGGAVGTDALDAPGLAYTPQAASGAETGGVIYLLYLCAYILQPGTAVWDIVRAAGFDKIFGDYVATAEDGSTFPLDPGMMFFGGDSVRQEIIEGGLQSLVRFPMSALTTPTSGSAWRTIPSTYVTTQTDYGVPRVYQDIMLSKVKSEGVDLRIEDYDTCHSIFISREKEMVQIALQASQDERNQPLA
ncbi:alpha/beta-hydrolase [Aspergillus californicus]